MYNKSKKTCIFVSILVSIWILSTRHALANETVTSYVEWNEDKVIDDDFDILKGAKVVVNKGVTITFKNTPFFYVEGEFFVKGTRNEPVKIKSGDGTGYTIYAFKGAKVTIQNADISGGGERLSFYSSNAVPAINIYESSLEIQGMNFHDNIAGIGLTRSSGKVRINRSSFRNTEYFNLTDPGYSGDYDLRYNWWGSTDDPRNDYYVRIPFVTHYKKIVGSFDLYPWRMSEEFRDPAIVVPGIFGSFEKNGTWQIDPIFHVYDDLIDAFKQNGYTEGTDLFVFPYDWRNSNVDNAKLLRDKIAEVKTIRKWPKVDVVAHSMGGLLARQYIESSDYKNDVDQLVTIGTPQKGAPESYLAWEGGEEVNFSGVVLKAYLNHEAKENGYADLFSYIHQRPMDSFQQLLPSYEYLFDIEANVPLLYPRGSPINSFLDNLNMAANAAKLKNVEFVKMAGNVSEPQSTITQIDVIKRNMGEKWLHGYPLGFEIVAPGLGDRGLVRGHGDGTVPIESAKSEDIKSDYYLELNSDHKSLPSDAQQDVLEALAGIRPSTTINSSLIHDLKSTLMFFVYSPIDIQIVSPSGKRAGKDFETGKELNEISGAYYSGYNTDSEFLTIPSPEDGDYKVLTQGTGSGEYRVEVTKISQDAKNVLGAVQSSIDITGIAEPQKQEKFGFKVSGAEVVDKDTVPPSITITNPENEKEYLNNQILKVGYDVVDDRSKSEDIATEVFLDNRELKNSELDLSLLKLGMHEFYIKAVDEAGNAAEKKIKLNVITNVEAISENVDHYAGLKLIADVETRDFLQVKITELVHIQDMLAKLDGKSNGNPKENQIKLFNKKIDDLIMFIEGKLRDGIDSSIQEILIRSLKFIRINP